MRATPRTPAAGASARRRPAGPSPARMGSGPAAHGWLRPCPRRPRTCRGSRGCRPCPRSGWAARRPRARAPASSARPPAGRSGRAGRARARPRAGDGDWRRAGPGPSRSPRPRRSRWTSRRSGASRCRARRRRAGPSPAARSTRGRVGSPAAATTAPKASLSIPRAAPDTVGPGVADAGQVQSGLEGAVLARPPVAADQGGIDLDGPRSPQAPAGLGEPPVRARPRAAAWWRPAARPRGRTRPRGPGRPRTSRRSWTRRAPGRWPRAGRPVQGRSARPRAAWRPVSTLTSCSGDGPPKMTATSGTVG